MSKDLGDLELGARTHAWDWFALHAGQRMQTFNYFLVATAFLAAAYASLLDKSPGAAAGVAVIGAWVGYWFTRLDRRIRQLINAGEAALVVAQARLAESTGIQSIKMLEHVMLPEPGASSYRQVIAVLEWSIVATFSAATVYALFLVIISS